MERFWISVYVDQNWVGLILYDNKHRNQMIHISGTNLCGSVNYQIKNVLPRMAKLYGSVTNISQ